MLIRGKNRSEIGKGLRVDYIDKAARDLAKLRRLVVELKIDLSPEMVLFNEAMKGICLTLEDFLEAIKEARKQTNDPEKLERRIKDLLLMEGLIKQRNFDDRNTEEIYDF